VITVPICKLGRITNHQMNSLVMTDLTNIKLYWGIALRKWKITGRLTEIC